MGLLNTIRGAQRKAGRFLTVPREVQCSSSVLPHCFNQCLAAALDLRDQGVVTHMAMVHSDIIAEPGWLDTLWSEMWYHKADLMAAVSPIKHTNGRTSTAVGDAADRWAVKRCLFLKDLERLPETFGPEHACGPGEVLLVNTALWLADLRRPWWDTFSFQFHTRIRPTADGRVADSRSEDWEMSHDLHQAGARVMVTRKVRLRHEGLYKFPNRLGDAA